jgi:hypothetical protein
MKKQESFRILCNGRVLYQCLSQDEMFEVMDELSQQYYETGVPKPEDLVVECTSDSEE